MLRVNAEKTYLTLSFRGPFFCDRTTIVEPMLELKDEMQKYVLYMPAKSAYWWVIIILEMRLDSWTKRSLNSPQCL